MAEISPDSGQTSAALRALGGGRFLLDGMWVIDVSPGAPVYTPELAAERERLRAAGLADAEIALRLAAVVRAALSPRS